MEKNKYFGSQKAIVDNALIEFQNVELQMFASELIDDLSPAVESMKCVQMVLEMQIELGNYIEKNGKNDRLEKSAKRLLSLFQSIVKLNTLTGDLNTLKLRNKAMFKEWISTKKENVELKNKIQKMIDAHNY